MKKEGNKGFTLIELLVVIAIIAILAHLPQFAVGKQSDSPDAHRKLFVHGAAFANCRVVAKTPL